MSPAEEEAQLRQWLPLVHHLAWQFQPKLSRFCSYDDLASLGTEALWRALRGYDPEHQNSASFKTYAYHVIVRAFTAEQHRWRASKRQAFLESMDEEIFELGHARQYACGLPTPEGALLAAEERGLVQGAIENLKESESFVLEKRVLDQLTLVEVGVLKGVSRERIRQIELRALTKLRKQLKGEFWSRAKHGRVDGIGHVR